MTDRRFLFAAAVVAVLPAPLLAQTEIVQRTSVPEADELAGQMRSLATNPLDLNALIRAGELTLDMGDTTAAAGFFARAERIDPRNGRIKAGLGGLLVLSERPGEALRRFAEAESLGRDPRYYAAQRGLAYDLVGQQERAQRDYRLALRTAPDNETVRRYALSLGISGLRDQALAQIDSLLRRSDRGAWRSRAFILAMTGDPAGASRIAGSMMPGGMAQGLEPFFERLPQLGPADRAFAVHFGEVRATPQRLADARMTPSFGPLLPEPGRQIILASQVPTPRPDPKAERRAAKKAKRDRDRGRLAATTVPPPVPLPQPPAYVASVEPDPVPRAAPIVLAARTPETLMRSAPLPERRVTPVASEPTTTVPTTTVPTTIVPTTIVPVTSRPVASADRGVGPGFTRQIEPSRVPPAVALPPEDDTRLPADDEVATSVTPPVQPVATVASPLPQPLPQPVTTVAATPPVSPPSAPPQPVAVVAPQRPPVSDESILARIVADITIPGSELETSRTIADLPKPSQPGAIDPAKAAADKKAAAAKLAADKKIAADKKALADKKLADKKAADIAKADPARIWVQVAGGANEGTLPKEWAKVRDKAPAAFKGKSGWTTPLRATNRVLAGPFKTNDEARAFVNLIAKSGVSGFTFTSEAGQKIAKLPPK